MQETIKRIATEQNIPEDQVVQRALLLLESGGERWRPIIAAAQTMRRKMKPVEGGYFIEEMVVRAFEQELANA